MLIPLCEKCAKIPFESDSLCLRCEVERLRNSLLLVSKMVNARDPGISRFIQGVLNGSERVLAVVNLSPEEAVLPKALFSHGRDPK